MRTIAQWEGCCLGYTKPGFVLQHHKTKEENKMKEGRNKGWEGQTSTLEEWLT